MTQEEYKLSLQEINILMDKKKKTELEMILLHNLSEELYKYEQANHKIERPSLYQRIKFRLDQKPIKYYIMDFIKFIKDKLL